MVRKRKGRKRATGSRAPILVEASPNARWSIDFVHDQLSNGRRFRILNLIDDVAKEYLAAVAVTSISGQRGARGLDVVIAARQAGPGRFVSLRQGPPSLSLERDFSQPDPSKSLAEPV